MVDHGDDEREEPELHDPAPEVIAHRDLALLDRVAEARADEADERARCPERERGLARGQRPSRARERAAEPAEDEERHVLRRRELRFAESAEVEEHREIEEEMDEAAVKRAAKDGDKDLAWLLAPSRERALALNKAYMAVVREQSFELGRDAVISPPKNVQRRVRNGLTENGVSENIHRDAKIWLDWK